MVETVMSGSKVYLSRDARAILRAVREELDDRRPEDAAPASHSDAVLELAREADRY